MLDLEKRSTRAEDGNKFYLKYGLMLVGGNGELTDEMDTWFCGVFVFCLLKTDNSWAAAYYYLIIIILTTGYSVDYSIGESSNRICSQWFPF